jgi:energy-coupling factor transporter ATP-binding protein EcfA2
MLDSVSFNNFRGLDNITVPLSQFTMLTGANGVGKTSVLEGLYCLFSQTRLDVSPLTRYKKSVGLAVGQTGVSMKQSYNYKMFWDECPSYGSDKCAVEAKSGVSVWSWEYTKAIFTDITDILDKNINAVDSTTEYAKFIWRYLNTDKNESDYVLSRVQAVSPDGGLYLYSGKNTLNKHFFNDCCYIDFPLNHSNILNLPLYIAKLLTIASKFINPHVTDIRLSGVVGGLNAVLDDVKEVSISSLGNGAEIWVCTVAQILSILAKYPDGMNPSEPVIFVIDEMGAGVHYSVTLAMWKFLVQLAEQYPYTQFVFTSHSDDCIKAYCEVFAESDEASVVRMHRTFKGQKIGTTEYKKADFLDIAKGNWEVRG